MAADKATLIMKSRDQNGQEVNQRIGYVNVDEYLSSDVAVVNAFKVNAKNLAVGLNSLTTNTLVTAAIESVEDITSEG